jgi:hypothetical protein
VVPPCLIEALVGSASPILPDQGSSYVHWTTSLPRLYIRNIIPDDVSIPLLEHLALSGWGYADLYAGGNFAITEFSEVREFGFLRS